MTTVDAWIEFLESDQHKQSVRSHPFLQNPNDPLDFRENLVKMEKSNIRKVSHIRDELGIRIKKKITNNFLAWN